MKPCRPPNDFLDFGDKEVFIERVTDSDHSKLSNRYSPDQHPIDAITGLREALEGKVSIAGPVAARSLLTVDASGDVVCSGLCEEDIATTEQINEIWSAIRSVKEEYPTAVYPTINLSAPSAIPMEVGTVANIEYEFSLNPGSYTYGPDTGIRATKWLVEEADGDIIESNTGKMSVEVSVTDNTSVGIKVTAEYNAGTMPVTNLGNPYPTAQIPAGKISTQSDTLSGYRSFFYGAISDRTATIDSKLIRSLTNSNKPLGSSQEFTMNIPANSRIVVIAIPSNLGKSLMSVLDKKALGTDISSVFKMSVLPVEGANGYKSIDYDVYVYSAAVPLSSNVYTITIE